MPINGPTTDNREALVDTDFETDAFAHGPLLQPVVKVDATLSILGSGSTANPLGVLISTDANNDLTRGADDGLYLDASAAGFSFDITDTVTTQTVNDGNTLTFVSSGIATAVVTAVDTVTVDVTGPTFSVPTPYFTGT